MFDWIHMLPLWSAKAGAALLFSGVLLFIWRLPADFIYHGAPNRSLWRDLRLWATLLLLLQGFLYTIF